jgi:hypothetical protein
VPLIVSCIELSALSSPETAFTLTDSWEICAVPEAVRVKLPGDVGVTESELGVTVTPLGRPAIVTVAAPGLRVVMADTPRTLCGKTQTKRHPPGQTPVRSTRCAKQDRAGSARSPAFKLPR